jgi:uncharacterized protein (TIGR04255 family)
MAEAQSYSKPPVSEALIDIRVEPLPAMQLDIIRHLHEQLIKDYPTPRPQQRWEGSLEIGGDSITTGQKAYGVTGYSFESQDRKRIVQYRLDGFTCNFLKPDPSEAWVGWKYLRDESKRTWDLYATALGVQEVIRVAVRYINKIVIPGPLVELTDYFTTPPDIPKNLEYQNVAAFLSRLTVLIPELQAYATITQAPAQELRQDGLVVLLDIDIARTQQIQSSSEALWQTLDRFREIKNSIFEKSLTPRAKELFK